MTVPAAYEACSEAYTVEKTVEVVIEIGEEKQLFRIEALRDLRHPHYCTRAYRQEHITLQPTDPQAGEKPERAQKEFVVWVVDYDLPLTDREGADEALSQALSFLQQRCKK